MSLLWTLAVRRSVCLFGGLSFMVLAGCAASNRPADVPGSALFETGGPDRLVFVASAGGTLYISDQTANAILYSGPVLSGDHIVVDPATNRVTINDQVVVSTNVNHNDHRIFLAPGATPPPPAALSSASLNVPRPTDVPPTARVGAEGKDRVEYTATEGGVAWVTDATRNNVVYRTRVGRGDRIAVDPAKNSLMVNGTRAFDGQLAAGDYCIFFSPGPEIPAAATPPVVSAEIGTPVAPAPVPPVPSSAVVVSESGAKGIFTATRPGSVWVTDTATGRVIFSGQMRQDDTLVVDADAGRITLNGAPAVAPGIAPGRYRVSFLGGK